MEKIDRASHEFEIMSGTLIGLGVISIVQMLGVSTLDVPLKISLCSFAVSIPSLSAAFLCMREDAEIGFGAVSGFFAFLFAIGNLGSVIGIGALFFHFYNYAGIIFIMSSLTGVVGWLVYRRDLHRLSEP